MKITENVFFTGVFNPNLRVFDIIMKTDYGTTYNAYLVKGSEKTALIETVHLRYFDRYLENIRAITDPSKIDYLIMNHNEPDHSGSIARLCEIAPNITVVTSQAGSLYLKNIINNPAVKVMTVKDGDKLSLGDRDLTFINAPFLHWPDSMFTWDEQEKALFSCDFLGAHYCEPYVFDTKIAYPAKYADGFKGYYDAIFGPFKPYVLKGLEKIEGLDVEYACVSHGPILTKGGLLEQAKERYRAWSQPHHNPVKTIPIFYVSAYGNTELLAGQLKLGILEAIPDAQVDLFDVIEHDLAALAERLNTSDAFAVGSPTINRDALMPVWDLLSRIEGINCAKKPALVFGSYGWSGEAVPNITQRLASLKLNVWPNPVRTQFVPTAEELEKARAAGKAFAESL